MFKASYITQALCSHQAEGALYLCCAHLAYIFCHIAAGSLGRRMACSSAVLGLYFSISESYLSNLADGRVPDDLCTMAAGARLCFCAEHFRQCAC